MNELKMCQRTIILLLLLVSTTCSFDLNKLKSYVKTFNLKEFYPNNTDNVLWRGLLKDCAKKSSFSCIQKNVYTYLDDTFTDRDNITVFDGFIMTKNNLNYHKYSAEYNRENNVEHGDVDGIHVHDDDDDLITESTGTDEAKNSRVSSDKTRDLEDNYIEPLSPLEEVTTALHEKAIKFLATRDYEVQLPNFFFEGATIKLSPKEVDEDGALIRVDFKQRAVAEQGRIFLKKIKKFIQNKLVTSFLALLLIIKLIKIKFMFIIPFLFGVGTAKKLFLKMLLFLIPAFAHVFKLCSSYYSTGTKYHHHHHQIAHHHHHVPVPVPIPAYHDHHPHHHETEEFDGYDYTQPHIQYRKDIEELKEWGIEPYEDPGVVNQGPHAYVEPAPGPYGMPQYAANVRPVTVVPNHLGPFEKYAPQIKYDKPLKPYENPNSNVHHTLNNIGMTPFNKNIGVKPAAPNLGPIGNHAQSLAYNGYFDDIRFTRAAAPVTEPTPAKVPYHQQLFNQQSRPGITFAKNPVIMAKSDNTDNQKWFSGSVVAENVVRSQHSLQPTVQSPVYVQNVQLGNSGAQNFGQSAINTAKYSQPLSANAPNVNSFQHPSNTVSNNQQSLHRKISGSTATVEIVKHDITTSSDATKHQVKRYDDDFYGPILARLEETFRQLRFVDESCRERLVCSMYKNPTVYAPHSNLVSNELSREPEELRQGNRDSTSGQRFQRYLNAARVGQDGGDCLRLYSCHINTE